MQHCFRVKTHSLSLWIFIGVGQPNKAKKVARLNLTSTYLLKHSYKELQIPQIKIQSKYFTPKARWVTPKPRSQWSVLRSKLLRFRLWNELAYCVQRTYVNATLESFTKHGNLINSFLHLPSNSFNSVAICCCCHQCDQIGLLLKHIGKKSCYKSSPNILKRFELLWKCNSCSYFFGQLLENCWILFVTTSGHTGSHYNRA